MIDTSFAGEIIDYLMAQDGEAEKFINLFLAAKCLSDVRNRSTIAVTATKLLNYLRELTKYGDKERASSEEDYKLNKEEYKLTHRIRTQAVAEIAAVWKDDPETLSWLKTCVQSDKTGYERQAALEEIAKGWKNDPNTLPILKTYAQGADDWGVQFAAVRELARGWKNDSDTLPILQTCAQAADSWSVRRIAVQELAKGWKDEPWMFEFLCARALNDPFERK
jgi:predicted Zn-dependent protease